MPSITSLQPFEAAAFAPHARGALGGIAASSSRGAQTAANRLAAAAPSDSGPRRLGVWSWAMMSFAAWGLLVGGRAQIVRIAPAVAPLYSAIGLGVNLRRMEIENVVSRLADEDGRQILIVEGEIRNLAETPRAAPRMRLAVLDAGGQEIYSWVAAPPKSRLAASEKAEFRARLAAPPREGREVRARFADEPNGSGPGR